LSHFLSHVLSRVKTAAASLALWALALVFVTAAAVAGDVHVNIPQRGMVTPAQKLNRDGVAELKRGHTEKAKRLFYKAYLLDPEDPFTLNNLGYVSELEGDADRALRYYALASRDRTNAVIDQSSLASLKGRPLSEAFRQIQDSDQEVNKINERAIVMLEAGNVFEARNLLKSALPRHPRDPFLLNNLGFAMESLGDVDSALRYYSAAASEHSTERVVVTPRAKWRGKPISEVAAENAAAVSEQIARGEGNDAKSARLNLRGVAALNDNDAEAARGFFLQAYRFDAGNAFTLNNLGYLAEMAGDRESAEMYYEAARAAEGGKDRVSYATRTDAEGQKIDQLAGENQLDVQATLKAVQEVKRRAGRPIELKTRAPESPGDAPGSGENAKPVPPIGVRTPDLPTLPAPNVEKGSDAPNSARPEPAAQAPEPQ
jgi:Flp pilus assembly protein TadD